MTTIEPNNMVVQDREPISAKLNNEVVMLSVRAQSYFGLGQVGSEIWNLIATPRRVSDICVELVRQYDVDPASCERDVLAFLQQLLERGLIHLVDQPESSQ